MNGSWVSRGALALLVVVTLGVADDARPADRAFGAGRVDLDGGSFDALPTSYGSTLEEPGGEPVGTEHARAGFDAWRQLATFLWGDAPADRSFIVLDERPSGATSPVRLEDERILVLSSRS